MRITLGCLASLALFATGCSSNPCNKDSDCSANEVCSGLVGQAPAHFFDDGGAYTCSGACVDGTGLTVVDASTVENVSCLPITGVEGTDGGS